MFEISILPVLKYFLGLRKGREQENPTDGNTPKEGGVGTLDYVLTVSAAVISSAPLGMVRVTSTNINDFLKTNRTLSARSLTLVHLSQATNPVVASKTVRRVATICPNIKALSLEGINFLASHCKRRVKLEDLPPELQALSLRGSVVDVKTLMVRRKVDEKELNLTALDLGRCFFVNDSKAQKQVSVKWPAMPHLQELYLEGCPFLNTSIRMRDIVSSSPKLCVLDLEGTNIDGEDLRCLEGLSHIQELYVGYTDVDNSFFLSLGQHALTNLKAVCLVQTRTTDIGLIALCQGRPGLRSVRMQKSRCSRDFLEEVDTLLRDVKIEWCCGGNSVCSMFRHQGCEHYASRLSEPRNE